MSETEIKDSALWRDVDLTYAVYTKKTDVQHCTQFVCGNY